MTKREKIREFAKGFAMFATLITLGWSIAYSVIAYIHDVREKEAILAQLTGEAKAVSGILSAAASEERDQLLQGIAALKGREFILVAGGEVKHYRSDSEPASPPEFTNEQLLASDDSLMVQKFERKAWLGAGYAYVGIPAEAPDQGYDRLFVVARLPGLFAGYQQELFTMYGSFVVMILIVLCMRPWRQGMHGWVEVFTAIRRIGKGDFTVSIQKNRHMPSQLGELADSINDMTAGLSQLEEMRQSFISNVSHEIQSPLTSIRGFARALQDNGLEEEQRQRYYNIIETESIRLSKLSDNLLKLTSLDSDKHPFEPEPYRLDKQLRRMILACEPQWSEKEIVMDVELPEIRVVADEDMMSQVWMNLLSNSIKFTPVKGCIHVEAHQENGEIVVVLSDSGIGIAQEDVPHIFDRFFKADKARDRSIGGSGLGLSIVKRILDIHGGSADVTSALGKGTTIRIILPSERSE